MGLRESRGRDRVTASLPCLLGTPDTPAALLVTEEAEQSSDTKQSCLKERLPLKPQDLDQEAELWKGPSAFNSPLPILHTRKVRPRADTDMT